MQHMCSIIFDGMSRKPKSERSELLRLLVLQTWRTQFIYECHRSQTEAIWNICLVSVSHTRKLRILEISMEKNTLKKNYHELQHTLGNEITKK